MKPAQVVAPLAFLLGITIACGSESGDNGGGGASSGSAGNGASGGLFGGDGDGGPGGPGSSGGDPNACNAPVDMFIMFDRSGSMARNSGNGPGDSDLDCNIGDTTTESKWCRAINALSGYFKSQASDKAAAAIQFFPLNGHTNAQCDSGDGYHTAAKPAADYQTLPSDVFDADLNAQSPDTDEDSPGTPTEAAIRGLTRFTAEHRRGGRVTIGILITDGDPTNINGSNCDTNLGRLSDLLKDHHDATQVRTYVVGMEGASDDKLETIAEGGDAPLHPNDVSGVSNACGGAAECRHWNVGNGDPAVFAAVLTAIQQSADGCKEGGGFVNPVN